MGVAEEQGFEPWVRSHVRRFSRPVHSTTLPLLRQHPSIRCFLILKVGDEQKIKPNPLTGFQYILLGGKLTIKNYDRLQKPSVSRTDNAQKC
jgi:hypothetical protein